MKSLDFNALTKPTLELTMRDENQSVITVTTPTERLIERLTAGMGELKDVLVNKNEDATSAAFQLAADIISCNLTGLQVSADDLRDKYRFDLYDLVAFFKVYMEFIAELQNAKN